MERKVEVAIVGAGQAGLATSWYLSQAKVDHVILETGRVGETWRSRRWDSFCLVTPNWSVNLPGGGYAGPDPDGFMPRDALVDHLESWSASFHAPVTEGARVDSLEQADGGFALSLPSGRLHARRVVVASGAYQRPHRPAGADSTPLGLAQLFAEDYRNPAALPPGAVLVVGSGQTGCQLAEELHEAGRRVIVACGRCPWVPRRLGGRDIVWWMKESGFLERTPGELPSPAARLVGNPQASGHDGGHDLHFRTLHQLGVELVGRYLGAEDGMLHFADDLAASVDFGDARRADLWKYIDAHCAATGEATPAFEVPPPMRIRTRTKLDVDQEGIGVVIWTSGYRPGYDWVKFPVFDDMGFPVQTDGRTAIPGLYFVGVHYLRKLKSSILYGVGEDAEIVADQIIEGHR